LRRASGPPTFAREKREISGPGGGGTPRGPAPKYERFLPAWGDFTRNEKIGIIAIVVAVVTPVVIALLSGA
jgi:hypothetical protein